MHFVSKSVILPPSKYFLPPKKFRSGYVPTKDPKIDGKIVYYVCVKIKSFDFGENRIHIKSFKGT